MATVRRKIRPTSYDYSLFVDEYLSARAIYKKCPERNYLFDYIGNSGDRAFYFGYKYDRDYFKLLLDE